jgi:hypothetical protein
MSPEPSVANKTTPMIKMKVMPITKFMSLNNLGETNGLRTSEN